MVRSLAQTAAAILVVFAILSTVTAADAPRIPKDDLKAKLGNPDFVIIDVRAVTDWLVTKQKIKGAVRENPRNVEGWVDKYPKDKTIVLYCA